MEYCKSLHISLFECATLTQSALYLTCECVLIGTPECVRTRFPPDVANVRGKRVYLCRHAWFGFEKAGNHVRLLYSSRCFLRDKPYTYMNGA
jgi:hypothetical protein